MNLDGSRLAVGDPIHHLQFGRGEVISVGQADAHVKYGGIEITMNQESIERHGVKMVGRGKPLVIWPAKGENVERLSGIVEEARKL